jgi:hypothetical protein
MALGIFKKAWNTTQLSDLTEYFSSRYISRLNGNNTASGVDSATINGSSGVIQYSQSISGEDYHAFKFTNSSITSSSIIFFSIKSPSAATGGSGLPYVQSYSISSNTVTVVIANSDKNATNDNFFLNFLIVN